MAIEETQTVHDFIAETKGKCFLCSNNAQYKSTFTGLDWDLSGKSSCLYSLHCLARYLNLDMRKVFTGSGPIPSHLKVRVEKSRLKAELCEECAGLTENFSKLFRQLEKIDMEMTSCLNLIQGKLERAVRMSETGRKPNSEEELMAKLEITEALRKDAIQKSSHKLCAAFPKTRLQKLTWQQVKTKKRKIEAIKVVRGNHTSIKYSESNFGDDDIGTIGSPASVSVRNEDGRNNLDEQVPPDYSSPSTENYEYAIDTDGGKQEAMEGIPDHDDNVAIESTEDSEQLHPKRTNKTMDMDQLSQGIPPPINTVKGVGVVEKPKASRNPETGKYKCLVCSREYSYEGGFQYHYKSAHLKVRFKCGVCEKDFPFRQNYERHYLNIHMGVRFQCGKCNKTFSQKGALKTHQCTFGTRGNNVE